MNDYIEFCWLSTYSDEEQEIIASYLEKYGFEGFASENGVFKAYIAKYKFNESLRKDIETIPIENISFYTINELELKNWNSEWESNFQPVNIANKITIYAPFHKINITTEYAILIQPKMSFGTGHHETTSGILELMLNINFRDKTVCDMGCGTGILAIFASMLGAKKVEAYDNDSICIENSIENIKLNNIHNIEVFEGSIEKIVNKKFDAILANINRNTLLEHIPAYSLALNKNGLLLMSGFYESDLKIIEEQCNKHNLFLKQTLIKNNWCISLFTPDN